MSNFSSLESQLFGCVELNDTVDVIMMSQAPSTVEDLFFQDRVPSTFVRYLLFIYFPIGLLLFLIRLCIGVHVFLIACLLRKTTALRRIVLRIMCSILGIVVVERGKRDERAHVLCANHVSAIDHLAVDLCNPCILPSVWDIPNIIRWCFGYMDLGASRGRQELIRESRKHIKQSNSLPLLTFPEGEITSGERALLKFNPWPCEVSDLIQPVSIHIYRPVFNVNPSAFGSSWWADCFWFMALPFSIITVTFLNVVEKEEQEPYNEYCDRVSQKIAESLGISVSNFTNQDVTEVTKRRDRDRMQRQAHAAAQSVQRVSEKMDHRRLDELTMRIKQFNPQISLFAIKKDLQKTRSTQATLENIKSGKLQKAAEAEDQGHGKVGN
ncbi:hypothetical protein WR25_06534 isoform B [Diploscapter pachys]|uniref:CUE domain-containing protein n=1 Tax=Diploscapter pachys TaxID=2018661 RepID=A0A2A2K8C8_9BILA|nr:hypothetical protein WR25_06534 isoform B [Diploscapter pachys]